jgi:hypothetical protein
MLRALKVALAVVIPAVAIWVVMFWTARGPFTASVVPWFAGYLLVIAAPQLMVLAIGARRSSRHSAVIGGLVSLDAWLIFIACSEFHSNDEAGLYRKQTCHTRKRKVGPKQSVSMAHAISHSGERKQTDAAQKTFLSVVTHFVSLLLRRSAAYDALPISDVSAPKRVLSMFRNSLSTAMNFL